MVDMTKTSAKPHVPKFITLHHGGVAFLRDKDPKQYLRNLQSWSRGTRLWADIPYHCLIDLDGNVYEGRDVNYAGETNTEYDPSGHALIVVLGILGFKQYTVLTADTIVLKTQVTRPADLVRDRASASAPAHLRSSLFGVPTR